MISGPRHTAAFAALLAAGPAFADDPATLFNPVPADALRGMDTDRPNVTNTPHTIDAGHLQIETGLFDYTHAHDALAGTDDSTDALTLAHVNFRLGILDALEVNAALDSVDFFRNTDRVANRTVKASGVGDLVLGGKLALWGDAGSDAPWATALAFQPQIKIPTALAPIGNRHSEYFFGVPFLVNLVADFHLGLQTIASRERNLANTGYATGWRSSASVDHILFGQLDAYLEYAAHVTTEHGAPAQQTIDIGATYPLNDNVVLDTGVAFGVTKAAPALEWTAGFSVRF